VVQPIEVSTIGKWIVLAGLGIVALGLVVILAAKLGIPIRSLPGDIRIERKGFLLYLPIVTGIVLSILLTVLVNIAIRLFRR